MGRLSDRSTALRVVVVGGGLTGLAAAARLAKRGHRVTLLEAADRLGGAWAARAPGCGGATSDSPGQVSAAPAVIGFPAPWRDLFRKSGRPLEAELDRAGRALLPAPPALHRFADGAELVLPTDRGEQYAALSSAYGISVADAWRDLLDRLDDTWQALRPLGLEGELTSRRQLQAARSALLPGLSVQRLAETLPHPHLRALVRSTAYRLGSVPEDTPAWCAVELSLTRRFGRWAVDDGRTETLLELLIRRTELRRVESRTSTPVDRVEVGGGRVVGVTDATGGFWAADAVVCTTDLWQARDTILPRGALARDLGAALGEGLQPAYAPRISRRARVATGIHGGDPTGTTVVGRDGAPGASGVPGAPAAERDQRLAPVQELVELSADGVPVISWSTPSRVVEHDYRDARPDPSWGPRWRRAGAAGLLRRVPGAGQLLRRPPIRTGVPGLLLAGASSPAGAGPSQVLLSAALASAACDGYAHMSVSSGEDRAS